MNVERINQLADFLDEQPDAKFNIRYVFSQEHDEHPLSYEPVPVYALVKGCGTAACVAGWALAVFSPETTADETDTDLADRLLGLTPAQGQELFMPPGWLTEPETFTRQAAVLTLRRLARTGEVQWQI